MGRHCAAYGCTNSSNKESCKKKRISFHFFPKDKLLLRRWLINVRRANFKPSQCSLLCSDHFTDDNFQYQPFTNRRQLKKDAIPTLFSFEGEEKRQEMTEIPYDNVTCRIKDDKSPDFSDSNLIDSEMDLNEIEENISTLLDASMNEKFYSPQQLKTFANSVPKCSTLNNKCYDVLKNKKRLKGKLKAKISLKALKKQWLNAEIKAATAKRDYYETKKVMLGKLQNVLDFENSSNYETSTALQSIKKHLKKEELVSKIEKKMLKEQLKNAEINANDYQRKYIEAKIKISHSDDV